METKEELLERAKELDVEGRSTMNKEELEKAVAQAEAQESGSSDSSEDREAQVEAEQESMERQRDKIEEADPDADVDVEAGLSHHSPASDPEIVGDELSPSGQEALEAMGEDSVAATEADLGLDASGPLHLEHPATRIMTGAVNEGHAKEQEELLKNKPEDYVGPISEAGFDDEGNPHGVSYGVNRDVKQEDVIDFPPPLAEREEALGTTPKAEEDDGHLRQAAPGSPFSNTAVAGGGSLVGGRSYGQKAVMYTDGLSGHAESNLERAYEVPERLQSNNPQVRSAGDESESEARQEDKSDAAEKEAEEVTSGEREKQAEENAQENAEKSEE